MFSQPQRTSSEKPAELGMRLAKEVQELFPVTLHRDELTVVLILIKLNKSKTSDKIFKTRSYNSLNDLQECLLTMDNQENLSQG